MILRVVNFQVPDMRYGMRVSSFAICNLLQNKIKYLDSINLCDPWDKNVSQIFLF